METNDTTSGEGPPPGDTETMTPPPPPPHPSPPKILRRPTTDRRLTGVARGVSEYTDIDVTIVRILFVVLTLFGGSGLILYLAGSILIPSEDAGPGKPTFTTLEQLKADRSPATIVGIVVLGVGAIVLLGELGDSNLILPLLLVAGGLVLLFRDPQSAPEIAAEGFAPAPPPPAPPSATGTPPPTWVPPQPTAAMAPPFASEPTGPAMSRKDRRRERKAEKSNLGWLTFAALITYFGIAIVLDQSDVVNVDGGRTVAWGLVGLGAVLVLSAFLGRARGLIFWGFMLVPVMLIAGTDNVHLEINTGDVQRIDSIGDISGVLDSGIGEVVYDFTNFDLQGADRTIEIEHSIGHVLILAPSDVEVAIDASVEAGEILVELPEGRTLFAEGPDSDIETTLPGNRQPSQFNGTLALDISLIFGQIEVKR
ncbi:MAG: PspC domain-containing protein [Acidimicrobiales bacterium]